jgi:hypothetical protein
MKRRGRLRVWALVVMATVLAPATSAVRAQAQQPSSQPATDQFSQGKEYSDANSNECSKNNTSPYAGMNPLQCAPASVSADGAGGCSLPNATFLRKVGNSCYYCAPLNPPIQGFVIPMDMLAQVDRLGYSCAVDPSNPGCTAVCTGGPIPGTPTGPPLESGNPPGPGQPPVLAQLPPGGIGVACDSLVARAKRPAFTPAQVAILTKDIADAKAIVAKAKSYTDKNQWDLGTKLIALTYFGNDSPAEEQLMRRNITNVSNLLNGITSVTAAVFPSGADNYWFPTMAGTIAYVHPMKTGNQTKIFLEDAFWQQPATGPNSQAMVFVHELSHLPGGASAVDYAYGDTDCQSLVWIVSTPEGQVYARTIGKWQKTSLTPTGPNVSELPETSALENADSFKLFVYYVANQARQK